MEPVLQALLTSDDFIAKEKAELLADEKKTTILAPLSPLLGQLCLLSHERIGFGSVASGDMERSLHSQLGKIKGIPSSFPMPSQSSSSSSLAITPHQPSIRKKPPRVSIIERMTKSQGIQTASRLEQFCHILEKARNKENQFMLVLARQSVDPLQLLLRQHCSHEHWPVAFHSMKSRSRHWR
ncbi:uncharacterized protein MONOS_17991 [Monocercomonoides exilis]|uniref:uncharacterized protein n=1 Tax=Monocercomonoides exilis TaxID=2049356 RepID=UPI0035594072|nr:hypothetical protein MONOS_17991 [Monocercomonoides exilis]